jgi:hypothetical protein
MKVYEGARSLDGAIVTVDGKRLPPRLVKARSKAGFEWTYEGAGPAQLALALLADHLGDDQAALARDTSASCARSSPISTMPGG